MTTTAAILASSVRAGTAFPPEHAYVLAFVVAACATAGAVACGAALPRRPA